MTKKVTYYLFDLPIAVIEEDNNQFTCHFVPPYQILILGLPKG